MSFFSFKPALKNFNVLCKVVIYIVTHYKLTTTTTKTLKMVNSNNVIKYTINKFGIESQTLIMV